VFVRESWFIINCESLRGRKYVYGKDISLINPDRWGQIPISLPDPEPDRAQIAIRVGFFPVLILENSASGNNIIDMTDRDQ
jgi:hypothetical protein